MIDNQRHTDIDCCVKKMKTSVLVAVLMIAVTAVGCTLTSVLNDREKGNDSPGSRALVGYMVIEENLLYLDEVEIISREDTERIKELEELGENITTPSGYHIYNPATDKQTFEITKETTYTFVDYSFLFLEDEVADRLYTTT
jgi:hypothetical protein